MAAFQFPDPTVQQTVLNPITGSTYQWKEPPGKWVVTVSMRDVTDIIWEGDLPPNPVGDYKLWYSTDTLELYFYYCDANGACAWVPTSVPIQVLEDLNAFAAQAEVDIDQLQYKQTLLQNAVDQIYLQQQQGNYVKKVGGDSMEGPLQVEGGRTPDADGIVSTVKVLNVDSGQDSDLQLKQNGTVKVYVGKNRTTTTQGIKFNSNNLKITGSGDAELFTMNTNGVFYEGAYTADKHIATKQTVEEEIYDDITDKDDTNFFVRRSGDSMSGDLVIEDSKIQFSEIAPDGTGIKMKRTPGEDATLLRLENASPASGNSENFYNIALGGNSHYNGMQIKGGSGADEVIWRVRSGSAGQIYFYKEVSFENQTVKKVGTAVDDTDAVSYGQVKEELQEFRDNLIQDLTFGTWRYNSRATLPGEGRFFVRNEDGANSGVNPGLVTSMTFYESDFFGNNGAWDRVDVGELFTLNAPGGLQVKYRINSTAAVSGPSNEIRTIEVNYIGQTGAFSFIDDVDWSFNLTEFKDLDVDALDDTYLRLDAGNSPIVSTPGLEIKTDVDAGSGFGEASLTLNGKRDNANNSCAAIKFKNWNYDDSDEINGYITYRSNDTKHFFRFNQDIDLIGDVNLSFSNGGAIQHNGGDRIIFDAASNGNEGSGLVTFTRPGNTARRGVVIKGKYEDDDGNTVSDGDLFFTYTNDDVDAINYVGKISGKNNLVNKGYIDDKFDFSKYNELS